MCEKTAAPPPTQQTSFICGKRICRVLVKITLNCKKRPICQITAKIKRPFPELWLCGFRHDQEFSIVFVFPCQRQNRGKDVCVREMIKEGGGLLTSLQWRMEPDDSSPSFSKHFWKKTISTGIFYHPAQLQWSI